MSLLFASINDEPIVKSAISIPYMGLWVADAILGTTPNIVTGDQVSLVLGTLTMSGYAYRAGNYQGAQRLRIIGGKGGLQKVLEPAGYTSPGGMLLSGIMRDVSSLTGETIVLESDRSVGAFWVRARGAAQTQLNKLATSWYARPDGSIYIGARATTPITSDFDLLDYNGATQEAVIGVTDTYADWTPGRTFTHPQMLGTFSIGAVTHKIASGKVRIEVMGQ